MTPHKRRRTARTVGYAEISEALDVLADIIKATGNRKLLPVYEHLENELAKFADDDEVLKRVTKRARAGKSKPKSRGRK